MPKRYIYVTSILQQKKNRRFILKNFAGIYFRESALFNFFASINFRELAFF